jgi:YggT family protein
MLTNALGFLLQTLLGLFTLVLLLRFYFQLTGVPFKNPVTQALLALTNFVVQPTRRFIPNWGNINLAILVLAFLIELFLQFSLLWLKNFPFMVAGPAVWTSLIGLTLIGLLKLSIHIFLYAVIFQAILSWVNPYTPAAPVLDALTRPLLKPLRKFIPLAGGFDLTPLVVLIGGQLLLIVLITPLEQLFLKFL